MPNVLGFGNGQDGVGTLSGTMAPVDATFTGTSGATSGVTQTGKSFAAGDLVYIHQTQGTGHGQRQLNKIASYTSGTGAITFDLPLDYTFVTGAQIIKVPQYTQITLSGNVTVKPWNGSVGGIGVFMATGDILGNGNTINGAGASAGSSTTGATGGGFRGGDGVTNVNNAAGKGEGHSGSDRASKASTVTNDGQQGNGGGGTKGSSSGGSSNPAGGGGGGNGTAGTEGGGANVAGIGGDGGAAVGSADLDTLIDLGGGGGGCDQDSQAPGGASGGAIVELFFGGQAYNLTVNVKGGSGTATSANSYGGTTSGGAGAGGSFRATGNHINTVTVQLAGGTPMGANWPGGTGGQGIGRLQVCKKTSVTTDVSMSEQIGGHNFCSVSHAIL